MNLLSVDLETLEFSKIGLWPKRIRVLLIITIGLLMCVFEILFYVAPIFEHYTVQKKERLELQTLFEKTNEQAAHLSEYKQQVFIVKETLDTLTRQLPIDSGQAELLEELSQLATSCGLSFCSIKPLAEETKDFYKALPIELSLTGSYHSLGMFLSHVSGMQRMITIHDFKIGINAKNPSNLAISMTAKPYWGKSM